MTIYLAADHNGFTLKNQIAAYLAKRGYPVEDLGAREFDPTDDFPKFAQSAVLKLIDEDPDTDRAILICGSGQGMAIAANRFRGVRAIVARVPDDAKWGRHDDDANVLSLPAWLFANDKTGDTDQSWQNIVDTFLSTDFAKADRFIRRNRQLDELS